MVLHGSTLVLVLIYNPKTLLYLYFLDLPLLQDPLFQHYSTLPTSWCVGEPYGIRIGTVIVRCPSALAQVRYPASIEMHNLPNNI